MQTEAYPERVLGQAMQLLRVDELKHRGQSDRLKVRALGLGSAAPTAGCSDTFPPGKPCPLDKDSLLPPVEIGWERRRDNLPGR